VIVDGLFIYPVKSCAGIAVAAARVTERGLEHDRRWMVADERGLFLSQRTEPEMALVRTAIGAGGLELSREGLDALALPFVYDVGARVEVEVWGDPVLAVRHDEGSAWFSRALGRPVQLVCMPDDARRPVEPDYAREGDIVSFADGFPLLVANRASLEAMEQDGGAPIDMRRFRPNLVVSGAPAWAEDGWATLAVGGVYLRMPKPCARCSIPGVDPDTAAITKEPLRTLARLRTRDHKTWFGINAIPDGDGVLHVGDTVRLG
jgi:MOSC domain-containing protein